MHLGRRTEHYARYLQSSTGHCAIVRVCRRIEYPDQHESSSRYSGTDTDVIFNSKNGVPSALVSLPLRYMHSIVEMASLDDVEKVIQLLVAFVKSVQPEDDFSHRL